MSVTLENYFSVIDFIKINLFCFILKIDYNKMKYSENINMFWITKIKWIQNKNKNLPVKWNKKILDLVLKENLK